MTREPLRLSASAEAAGYRLLQRGAVSSTMDEARILAASGQESPFWLVADEQTGGRGRQGRVWSSPPGNLYVTLCVTDPCAQREAPGLGFVAGLAIHDAVCAVMPTFSHEFRLKWPNDLLWGDAKCAGLLLEGHMQQGRFEVLVGIGINLVAAPQDTPYPATALGTSVSRQALLQALSESWIRRLSEFAGGPGFAATRAAWLDRAAFLGEEVTLRLPEGPVTGVFEALEADGRLVLRVSGQRRIIDAGDLYFRAPAPAS